MYINGDFRSKKKTLGIIIYIKGREIWDLMKPILPWLGFVQIDMEQIGASVCTYHFQLIYLASFNINSFQSQTCTEDLG